MPSAGPGRRQSDGAESPETGARLTETECAERILSHLRPDDGPFNSCYRGEWVAVWKKERWTRVHTDHHGSLKMDQRFRHKRVKTEMKSFVLNENKSGLGAG